MRLHGINAGTLYPVGGRLITACRDAHGRPAYICRVLIVETEEGIILVDSGFGTADVRDPAARLGKAFLRVVRPALRPDETVVAHLDRLGLDPGRVTHILMTHLDLDHAGGLPDFPHARVIAAPTAIDAAEQPRKPGHAQRFIGAHFAHGPRWEPLGATDTTFHGWPAATLSLPGVEILAIPLPGHAPGHTGYAIRDGERGWMMHAGDGFMEIEEMTQPGYRPPLGVRAHHLIFDEESTVAATTRKRLQEFTLSSGAPVRLVNSHDPREISLRAPA